MSFTDIVQRKIAARRQGFSPRAAAAAEREARLRLQAAPLIAAIEALRDRLCEDPMFAGAIGRPDVVLDPRDDASTDGGHLILKGHAAELWFDLSREDKIALLIYPGFPVLAALKCRDMLYRPAAPVTGDLAHLDAFMALAEDHIADFIADVALSPATHVLEQDRPARIGFGT